MEGLALDSKVAESLKRYSPFEGVKQLLKWKKIQIKFRGVCIECKQEISPGNDALWSREERMYQAFTMRANDGATPGMNIVSVNKTCFVCEMQSPSYN